MESDPRQRAMRAMYERLPFPQRDGDHARYADVVVDAVRRHGAGRTGSWLDIGCGTGELLVGIARACPAMSVRGFDYSQASVALARERIARSGLRNVAADSGDATDPAWADASRDVVSALGSIHHLADPEVGFANAAGALRPGGVFALYFYGAHGRRERTLQQ